MYTCTPVYIMEMDIIVFSKNECHTTTVAGWNSCTRQYIGENTIYSCLHKFDYFKTVLEFISA